MRVNLFWKLLIANMHIVKITSTRKIHFFLRWMPALNAVSFQQCILFKSQNTVCYFNSATTTQKKREKKITYEMGGLRNQNVLAPD